MYIMLLKVYSFSFSAIAACTFDGSMFRCLIFYEHHETIIRTVGLTAFPL